jgi:hypothetical protein
MHDAMAAIVAACITRVSKDVSNIGFPMTLRVMSIVDIAIRIVVDIMISQSSLQLIFGSHILLNPFREEIDKY